MYKIETAANHRGLETTRVNRQDTPDHHPWRQKMKLWPRPPPTVACQPSPASLSVCLSVCLSLSLSFASRRLLRELLHPNRAEKKKRELRACVVYALRKENLNRSCDPTWYYHFLCSHSRLLACPLSLSLYLSFRFFFTSRTSYWNVNDSIPVLRPQDSKT
jgi:hypothetical protein